MRNLILSILLFVNVAYIFSQKITTDKGSLDNIQGISNYSIVFEYASDLKIPNYESEEDFIDFQVRKREQKDPGSGELFKKLWFENRASIYEPIFIEQFNNFKLKNREIHTSKNNKSADYTMKITINFIYPGYDVSVFEEEAKLGVKISIYKNQNPETILFSTKFFRIHGKGKSTTEYERVMTAFSELGRWTSKYFCRKT
jgi:hypothetical protein